MTSVRILLTGSAELLAALVSAAVAALLTLAAIDRLPFAEPSWLPETFAGTLIALLVVLSAWLLQRRATGGRSLWALGVLAPAVVSALHLGSLLHGSPHYLFGLGGDQANRVPYLGRFADSPALADVFYVDTAPFYPAQWFWVGGRIAALTGQPAWQFYKPYAVATMAIAGAIAFVTWRWAVGTRPAVVLGSVTAMVGLHTAAYEPYSWILICLLPQVTVATLRLCTVLGRYAGGEPAGQAPPPPADSGARPADPPRDRTGWALTCAIGVYLGWAALGYTLIAGFAALVVGSIVVARALAARHRPSVAAALLGHLAVAAAISAGMALVFWHRYLLALVHGARHEPSVANDFAPRSAAFWPVPVFEPTATGVLTLIGLIWLLVTLWPALARVTVVRGERALAARIGLDDHGTTGAVAAADPGVVAERRDGGGRDPDDGDDPPAGARRLEIATASAVLLAAAIGWYVLSGLRSVTGHTLLPFRMIPVVTLVLTCAGVFGALALARWALRTSSPTTRGRTRFVAVVLAALAAVQSGQAVSDEDTQFAAVARDTEAPPTELLAAIDELTGARPPSELVVLTDDAAVLAYRPYFSYQAPAQAYATPTGRYRARLEQIRSWARATGPADLAFRMRSGPFRAPDVLVLSRAGSVTGMGDGPGAEDGSAVGARPDDLVYTALVNVMPREANNRRDPIVFRAELFDDPALFRTRRVDPFVVIARR